MSSELLLLSSIVMVLALAVAVVFVCHTFRIPSIVGFLLTGVLSGPSVLALIDNPDGVSFLAEIGVVLLLFTIGLELSIGSLVSARRAFAVGGSMQVGLTILMVMAILLAGGQPVSSSLFAGFLVAISSTAIIFKLLQERKEIDAPHGRSLTAITIFQDMAIVPMMLLVPFLSSGVGKGDTSILLLVGKLILIFAVFGLLARWVVPRVLYAVARTRIRELFLLSVVIFCFVIVWLTSVAGLSIALGAFAAGLIISESKYSEQALGIMLPFRDVFVSFFFITIGMLIDVGFVAQNFGVIALLAIAVLVGKGIIAAIVTLVLRYPTRSVVLNGIYLSQIGEFSFVLAAAGLSAGLLNGTSYQLFLAVSILTMVATPLLITFAERWFPAFSTAPAQKSETSAGAPHLRDHLVIVGYGVNGRNLARTSRAAGIPYVIVETNPETVEREKGTGEPIIFGDATSDTVLDRAGIDLARVAVIAISDPPSTKRIVERIKAINAGVHVIARTRYVNEIGPLMASGADDVIPEEFETSVEILNRVLHVFLVPVNEVNGFIDDVRSDTYAMLRTMRHDSPAAVSLARFIPEIEVVSLRVAAGAFADGKTFAQIGLRSEHGATALAVKRGEQTIPNPGLEVSLQPGDVVVLMSSREKADRLVSLFT